MDSQRKTINAIACCAMSLLAGVVAHEAPGRTDRVEIVGEGRVVREAPAPTNARFTLQAQLVAAAPSPSAAALPADGRFAISALLSPASLVCYYDTIFRDSFDGSGL